VDGKAAGINRVASSGGWGSFARHRIGVIKIEKALGELALSPTRNVKAEDLFDVRKTS
tara:strand:+ start:161 stop:334 length:174 start_codon:yes stop_codon:yes gene_type:complete